MGATRPPREALAWVLIESLRPTASYEGLCLRGVRTALSIPALYPSAIKAWEAVPGDERNRTLPPPGKPIFWALGKHGHVALSCGFGVCWSTDILRRGKFDVVPTALIERRWGGRYLGWSESLNGVSLPLR